MSHGNNESLEISKREGNLKIVESVAKCGYNQKEVADCMGLHYLTISRLMKNGRSKEQD